MPTPNDIRNNIQQVYEFPTKGSITHLRVKSILEDILLLIEENQSGNPAPSGNPWFTVETIQERDDLTTMVAGDYCAVKDIRQVYEYTADNVWIWKFALDQIVTSGYSHRLERTFELSNQVHFEQTTADTPLYDSDYHATFVAASTQNVHRLELMTGNIDSGTYTTIGINIIDITTGNYILTSIIGITVTPNSDITIDFAEKTIPINHNIEINVSLSGTPIEFIGNNANQLYFKLIGIASQTNYVEVKSDAIEMNIAPRITEFSDDVDEFLKVGTGGKIITSPAVSPNHNQTGQLNTGDYLHLTAAEKTYFDTLPAQLDGKFDTKGFLSVAGEQDSNIKRSYSESTRTYTLDAVAYPLVWIYDGERQNLNAPAALQHGSTYGLYFYFFNSSKTFVVQQNTPWDIMLDIPVAAVLYNPNATVGQPKGIVLLEFHTVLKTRSEHFKQHFRDGAWLFSGGALSALSLNTDTDAALRYALSSAIIFDEDIRNILTAFSTTDFRFIYRDGTAYNWQAATVPVISATSIPKINTDSSGWTLSNVTNNYYFNYYVIFLSVDTDIEDPATPGTKYSRPFRFVLIPSQFQYQNEADAKAEIFKSLNLAGLPLLEGVLRYKLTFQYKSSYTNTPKSVCVAYETIENQNISLTVSPSAKTIVQEYTYTIAGEVKVPSGDTDFIIPYHIEFLAGQSKRIIGVCAKINSGTSATIKLTKNGSDISGFTGISVTTTYSRTAGSNTLASGDAIAAVVTAVSGTPKNMEITVFVEYTF